jgi:hypothetical protein
MSTLRVGIGFRPHPDAPVAGTIGRSTTVVPGELIGIATFPDVTVVAVAL